MPSSAILSHSDRSPTQVSQGTNLPQDAALYPKAPNSQFCVLDIGTSHKSQKRAAPSAPTPPASKQMLGLAVVHPQSLAPIHQIEIARHAAASLPAAYRFDEKAEAAKRTQASRAIDCWVLAVGVEYKKEPSNEVKACLQAFNKEQSETTQIDLRKPQTTWIRCTICLELSKWKVGKNNHSSGAAQHIQAHLDKEHHSACIAACEWIKYTPPGVSALSLCNDDVNEPLTSEGILQHLTEWFAEDDISFNMVSHPGFWRFVNYIGQGKVTAKDLPNCHSIANKATALSAEAKD